MSAALRVRAAYPFHRQEPAKKTHWACLLECGHTLELDLEPGARPRRLVCRRCDGERERGAYQTELFIDFGE